MSRPYVLASRSRVRNQVNPIDVHLSRPEVRPSGARIWARIDITERATNSHRITSRGH